MNARRLLSPLLLALLALFLQGCGLGAGSAPTAVRLSVTRDFGAQEVGGAGTTPRVHGQETVMSLLMRNAKVSTRYGGGFVQSINGLSGGRQAGGPTDWFYYVNGIEASKGAADTDVHPGDHIWWDLHDWSQTEDVPAVVGSFPEPFLNGTGGQRLPVRVECDQIQGEACRTVTARLRALGVPAALSGVQAAGGGPDTLRVLVGPWRVLSGDPAVSSIESGPRRSGVYARLSRSHGTLTVLDPDGHSVSTLGAGAGLIAATTYSEEAPAWVVTGTNTAGVDLAAHAFEEADLVGHFAVAITPSSTLVPLPEVSR